MYCDDRIAECRNGKAPGEAHECRPRHPFLRGAAFRLPDRPVFTDRDNGVEITVMEQEDLSARIRIRRKQ